MSAFKLVRNGETEKILKEDGTEVVRFLGSLLFQEYTEWLLQGNEPEVIEETN